MKTGPFKVDEEHESVIQLAKRRSTASVPKKTLLDQVINAFIGD